MDAERVDANRSEPPLAVPIGNRLVVRIILGVVAAMMCLVAIPQALWKARLEAPQYRGSQALHITAYGDRLVGDICELNDLNHYIGMRPLGEPDPPCGSIEQGMAIQDSGGNTVGRIADEMVLWLPSAVLAAVAAIVTMLAPSVSKRWLRRLLRWGGAAFLWLLPVGVLFMTQVHLYRFGHELDPTSAFHPDPFTPHVLGHSKIYQFKVDARPGTGLWLVIGAAALVTLGPWLITKLSRWIPDLGRWLGGWVKWITGGSGKAATTAVVLIAIAVLARPSPTSGANLTVTQSPQQMAAGSDRDAASDAEARGRELQRRFDEAREGDQITIEPGVYRGPFVVDTRVDIVGEDGSLLDGAGIGSVLSISEAATGTTVRGISLTGSAAGPSGSPAGLFIEADDVMVSDIRVTQSYMGVRVIGANRVHITDSDIASFTEGGYESELHATGGEVDFTGIQRVNTESSSMRMRGDGVTLGNTIDAVVENNVIHGSRDGIYTSYASYSHLKNNHITNSRYGIHSMYGDHVLAEDNYFSGNLAGFILMYGGPFDIRGNTIMDSISPATGFGLVLKDGSEAVIEQNVIASNRVGMKLDNGGATGQSSVPARVRANTIGMNQVGVEVGSSARGQFFENSFVENTVQVVVDGNAPNVVWNLDGVGNYWSNYRGYDVGGNGIGDVPFIQGGSVANTLSRSPVMISLASGPGFRILQAIEDRWAPDHPVAKDEFPLMEIRSPAVPSHLQPGRAPAWFGLSGLVVAVAGVLGLVLGRRPNKSDPFGGRSRSGGSPGGLASA